MENPSCSRLSTAYMPEGSLMLLGVWDKTGCLIFCHIIKVNLCTVVRTEHTNMKSNKQHTLWSKLIPLFPQPIAPTSSSKRLESGA